MGEPNCCLHQKYFKKPKKDSWYKIPGLNAIKPYPKWESKPLLKDEVILTFERV